MQNISVDCPQSTMCTGNYDFVARNNTEVYFLLPRKLRMIFSHNYHAAFPALPELPDFPDAIISLTSYPARIATVNQTVQSLLQQDISFKKIILWLAKEQFPKGEAELPDNLKSLISEKFTIEWCTDIRSYKKLIPALKKYPDDIIVTADDDLLYPRDWLRRLILSYIKNPEYLHCMRAHRITFNHKKINPYSQWKYSIEDSSAGYEIFCTSGGGVIFTRNHLHDDVLNEELFKNLCPDADDIWLWAMSVLKKTKIHTVIPSLGELHYIEGTQDFCTLYSFNKMDDGNDKKLSNIFHHYPLLYTMAKNDYYTYKYKKLTTPFYREKIENATICYFFGIPVYKKLLSPTSKKIFICGMQIFKRRIQKDKVQISILGIPFFSMKKKKKNNIPISFSY